MRDRVLKNEADFEKWKLEKISAFDKAGNPMRYPCLAKTRVTDWAGMEEEAEYLYIDDILIQEILSEFGAAGVSAVVDKSNSDAERLAFIQTRRVNCTPVMGVYWEAKTSTSLVQRKTLVECIDALMFIEKFGEQNA